MAVVSCRCFASKIRFSMQCAVDYTPEKALDMSSVEAPTV